MRETTQEGASRVAPESIVNALDTKEGEISKTPWGAQKTADLDIQFAIDPSFGLTKERYGWYSNNTLFDDTFFSESEGKIELETTATSNDSARLRSAYPGQYVPHALAEPGIGASIPTEHLQFAADGTVSLTHGEISITVAEWSDSNDRGMNSMGISYESDATHFQLRSGDSNVALVKQANWNIDTLDGSNDRDNPSGHQLTPQDGYVYHIFYTWYGQGTAILAVMPSDSEQVVPVHRFSPDANNNVVEQPNLSPTVVVENKGTAEALNCQVGGMQFATHGYRRENPKNVRETAFTRRTTNSYIDVEGAITNNSYDPNAEPGKPLVAFRRDEGELNSRASISVGLQDIYANSSRAIMLYIWDEFNPGSALTGENFSQPTSRPGTDESRLQGDSEATDYTPSSDAVVRSVIYIDGNKRTPTSVQGRASARLPIEATGVVTAVKAVGRNNTDAQPFKLTVNEGY
jgi:hypothetical protein